MSQSAWALQGPLPRFHWQLMEQALEGPLEPPSSQASPASRVESPQLGSTQALAIQVAPPEHAEEMVHSTQAKEPEPPLVSHWPAAPPQPESSAATLVSSQFSQTPLTQIALEHIVAALPDVQGPCPSGNLHVSLSQTAPASWQKPLVVPQPGEPVGITHSSESQTARVVRFAGTSGSKIRTGFLQLSGSRRFGRLVTGNQH